MFLGDLNRNLRTKNYNNNLNSLATQAERDLYTGHRKSLNSMLNSQASIPFSFTTYDSSSGIYNIDELMSQAQGMKNILEQTGGRLYGLDMETLGGYGEKSTELEKRLFSVTEIGLIQQDIVKNTSGAINANAPMGNVLLFGIEQRQADAYFELISKAKKDGWGTLTDTERSTVERLTRYSGRDVFRKGFNGKFTLNKLSASQPTNLEAARKGTLNLLDIGRAQGFNTSYGKQQLVDLRNQLLEANKSGTMLMTYNGSNFDLPFLNEVFKRNGLAPVEVSNHYDARMILNASTQNELQQFVQEVAAANGVKDFKPGKKPGSLETLAEAFKFDIDAHMALSDTATTMEIGTSVIPGKGVTVYDFALDQLSKIKNDPNNRTVSNLNKGGSAIYANRAVHIDKDSFDYMALDGKIQSHIDWSLNRGQFYNVEDMKFIPLNQMDKVMAAKVAAKNPNAQGLYAVQLRGAGKQNSHVTATLFRDNVQDFQELIQNNLSVHNVIASNTPVNYSGMTVKELRKIATQKQIEGRSKYRTKADLVELLTREDAKAFNKAASVPKTVTQGMIDAQVARTIADKSRRNFEGMFQLNSGRGFTYADEMYSTYNNVNKLFNDTFGRSATKEDIARLVANDVIEENGKKITATQALGTLSSSQRVETFHELYGVLGDTDVTMTKLINTIKSNQAINSIGNVSEKFGEQYTEMQRTLALRNAWNQIKVDNTKRAERTFADISGVDIFTGGDYIRINAANKSSAGSGVHNAVKSVGKHEHIKSRREFLQVEELKKISANLEERKLLPANFIKDVIKDGSNPYHVAQAIGGELFKTVDTVRSITSPQQMLDLDLANVVATNDKEARMLKGYKNAAVELDLFDTSSYRVDDVSLDTHLMSEGMNIEELANRSVGNVKPLFTMDRSSEGFEALEQYLRNHLGYENDTNIKNFKNMLYNNKMGMISAHDYSVAFVGGVSTENKMYMAFTDKTHSQAMLQTISDTAGLSEAEQLEELRKVAGVAELNKINKDFPVDSVSVGSIEKSITGSLNSYVAKNKEGSFLPAEDRLVMRFQDTIDESITNYIPKHKVIAQMISEGNFEAVNKSINRAFKGPILDGVGLSGIQTASKNGALLKMVIPNMSDIASNSLVDMSSTINLLPFLYENDPGMRKELDKLFTPFSGKNAINANKYMEQWKSELGSEGYGKLRGLGDFDITVQEWFVKNMVKGENILGKVVEHGDKLADADTVKDIKSILDSGAHQILREDKTAAGFVSKIDRVAMNTYGFMTGFTRPVQMQFQSFLSYDLKEAQAFEKELGDIGVRLGESVVTHEARQLYHNKMTGELADIQSTVTANMKQMHTHDLYKALDTTRDDMDSILTNLGGKYTAEDFNKVMNEFITYGDTNMQHSLYHPLLRKAIWNKNELITHRIKDFDSIVFKDVDNNVVDSNTLVGKNIKDIKAYRNIDGEEVEVRYNKGAGEITHIDGDTMYINPTKPQVNELKLGAAGVEKSVGSTIDLGAEYEELVNAIWKKSFGNAAIVSNFELGKHLSGSVVGGSYINYISERMSYMGREEEFIDLINKHLPSWKAGYTNDNSGKRILSIAGNPTAEGRHLEGINNLVKALKDKDKPHLHQIHNELQQMLKDNMYRVSVRRMIMSEMHSAQGAEGEFGKGTKVTPRGNQVLGSNFGMDPEEFRKLTGTEYEKIAVPILDRRMQIIEGSREFKEGMESLKGITATMQSMLGFKDVTGVKDVNLSDVLLPKSGIDADEMSKTLFEVAGHENKNSIRAFRLDLGDVQILNPITKKIESVAYIPLIKTQVVDGQVFLTESQKTVEKFMTSLKKLDDGYAGVETIEELQKQANTNYEKMVLSFEHELNHKDGIMEKFLTSGRMPFSGQALGSKVTSPVFHEMMNDLEKGRSLDEIVKEETEDRKGLRQKIEDGEMMHFYNDKVGKDIIGKDADGKATYKDVVYTSKEQLEQMGVKFEDIGEQVFNERLVKDSSFQQYLMKNNIIDAENKLIDADTGFSRIGEEFLKERGIYGTGMRYPVFKSTSDIAVNLRLDDTLNGRVFHIQGHTAMMWNADVDADRESIILNLEEKNGKVRLLSQNDKAEVATRTLFDAQAANNRKNVVAALDEYAGSVEKLATKSIAGEVGDDLVNYMNFIKGEQGEGILAADNYLRNDAVLLTAIKAKHNKGAIGYISTPNYILRDIAEEVFKNDAIGQKYLQNIYHLTDETEQKLIDVKHIKNGGEMLTTAPRYKDGLNLLTQGKHEEGLNAIIEAMSGPIYKTGDAVPTGKAIIEGTANFGDKNTQALHSLYTLFQDDMAAQIWNSPLERSRAGKSADEVIENLTNIYNNASVPESAIGRMKKRLLRQSMDTDFVMLNGKKVGTKDVLYTTTDAYQQGAYKIEGYGLGKNSKEAFMRLADVNTGDSLKIYGHDFIDISDKLTNNFAVASNKNAASAQVVNNISDRFERAALKDYGSFKHNSQEAELVYKSLNGGLEHDKIDLAKSVMDKYNTYEQQAIANSHQNFFNTPTGAAVEDFARHAEAMKNYNSDTGSLIKQYNDAIREAGANPRQIKEDMIINTVSKSSPITNRQVVISDISDKASRITESVRTGSNVQNIINRIDSAKLYNLHEVTSQLTENKEANIAKADPKLLEQYKSENIAKMIDQEFVTKPFKRAKAHNIDTINELQKNYSELVANDSDEAMSFLNWHSSDVVNQYINERNLQGLGEAKIAFGPHVGKSINEVSVKELSKIHATSIGDVPTELVGAMRQTQDRIGAYFSVLDEMGSKESKQAMERVTVRTGSTLGEDALSQIGDINDAIRKAGAETSNMESKVIRTSEEAIETASRMGKTAKILAGAGIALGLASVLSGTQFTAPPSAISTGRRPNGKGSPDVHGNYDEQPQVTPRLAPPTQKTIVGDNGTGVNYKIRAKSDGSTSNESILAAIKHTINRTSGPNMNVNLNTRDDTSKVSDNWLQQQIASLIK